MATNIHSASITFLINEGKILHEKITMGLFCLVGIISGIVAGVLIFFGLCLLFYTPKY
jgi:hypothetical protein